MMFIWIFIIGGIIYYLYRQDHSFTIPKSPMKVLDERLARGDIDINEYEQIKQILEESK